MAESQEPKVKLYWLDKSRAQNILWLLEELEIEYELEIFHRNPQTMLAPKELLQVHPLGKSPVIEITGPGISEPVKLAESGFITEYLVEHFPKGHELVPQRWKEGQENRIGGETESWMRYQYLLHYVEGSLLPTLLMALVLGVLRSPKVPFFIRPFTSLAVGQLMSVLVFPNAKRHLAMIDSLLATSPEGGKYICGPRLTAVDILLSYALIAAQDRFDGMGDWPGGSAKAAHPRVFEYIERLTQEPGYQRSVDKIREIDGKFETNVDSKQ